MAQLLDFQSGIQRMAACLQILYKQRYNRALNRMRFCIVVLILTAAGIGCNSLSTEERQRHYESALAFPLEFELPNELAGEAWQRAKQFLRRYSEFQIQFEQPILLETFMPRFPNETYGYRVTRKIDSTASRFTVECTTADASSLDRAKRNAHLLAYYMASGYFDLDYLER